MSLIPGSGNFFNVMTINPQKQCRKRHILFWITSLENHGLPWIHTDFFENCLLERNESGQLQFSELW